MKVSDVMTRDVRIGSPEQTILDAARLMAQLDSGALPVGENDRLVGMVTDRDIVVRGIAKGLGPEATLREIMSTEVKYCYDNQELEKVTRNMGDNQLRRLPVVNAEKRLVGILSLGDVAAAGGKKTAEALNNICQSSGDQHGH